MVVQQARFQPPLVYLEVMHPSWVYSEAGFLVLTTSLSSMVSSNIEFCEADQKLAVVSPNFALESAPGSARSSS